jgi:hypothetical protein
VAFAWGNFVFVRQSVRVAAVLAGVSTTSGATWLAAGPAFYQARFARSDASGGPSQTHARLGSAIAGGISTRRRIFVEMQGQYRWVGNVDMQPMAVDGQPAGSLPRTQVNFNHYTINLGLGVRW